MSFSLTLSDGFDMFCICRKLSSSFGTFLKSVYGSLPEVWHPNGTNKLSLDISTKNVAFRSRPSLVKASVF